MSTSYNTNLVLIYEPAKWVNVTFGIYNLFDENQTVPSALEHTNNGTDYLPLRGRVFRGVIRSNFQALRRLTSSLVARVSALSLN